MLLLPIAAHWWPRCSLTSIAAASPLIDNSSAPAMRRNVSQDGDAWASSILASEPIVTAASIANASRVTPLSPEASEPWQKARGQA